MIVLIVSAKRAGRFARSVVWCIAAAFLISSATIAIADEAEANPKYSGIVIDAKTGKALYSYKPDAKRHPASLTKIMTLYVLFEELEAGRLSLSSPLKVSSAAAGKAPSKLGLKAGSTIAAKDAILALVTKSANDVAAAVAENISGSEAAFARRMTETARRIGMDNTTFRNASGLPHPGQITTARDMATLGIAIQQRFPKYYRYFGTRTFAYRGRSYGNHNRLLGRVKGVDGIKTGYIRASGFNLVTSAKRDGREVVAVVMGGRSGASRDAQMTRLVNQYLPKASSGKRTAPALVAGTAAPTVSAAALAFAPLPGQKPELEVEQVAAEKVAVEEVAAEEVAPLPSPAPAAPVQVATQQPAEPVKLPPVPVVAPEKTNSINANARIANSPVFDYRRVKTVKIVPGEPERAAPIAAAEQLAPKPVIQAAYKAPAVASEETATIASNDSSDPAPGWQIQIGATDTEDRAISLLKRAKGSVGGKLRAVDPYTEPVDSGGATLYRARFVGFSSKDQAWNACKSLKKAKFNCYAIYE